MAEYLKLCALLILLLTLSSAQTITDFAKCLTDHGAQLYGKYYGNFTFAQTALFGDAASYLNYTECGVPGRQYVTQFCYYNMSIKAYPTWVFPDGTRMTGVQSLKTLSGETGCALPTVNYGPPQTPPSPVYDIDFNGTIDSNGNTTATVNMSIDFIETYFMLGVAPENYSSIDAVIKQNACGNSSNLFGNSTVTSCDVKNATLSLYGTISGQQLNKSDGFFKSTALINTEYLYEPDMSFFSSANSSAPGSVFKFEVNMPGVAYAIQGGNIEGTNTAVFDVLAANSNGTLMYVRSDELAPAGIVGLVIVVLFFFIAIVGILAYTLVLVYRNLSQKPQLPQKPQSRRKV